MPKEFQHYTIGALAAPLTAEDYLKQILHFPNRKIQKLTRAKGIFINRKPAFLQRIVNQNDLISILVLPDRTYGVVAEAGWIEILYEDESMIVLNKPPRQIVHPAGRTAGQTLANHLAYYFQSQNQIHTIRPLHRLDRDTSGCVAFAKSAEAQTMLEDQLKARQFKRSYLAVVQGNPAIASGIICQPIAKNPQAPNRRIVHPNGSPAITHYQVRAANDDAALLELMLDTGRTHQIRVHLAYLGHPILGDKMYGTASADIRRQALHAASLTFRSLSVNESVTLRAPLPQDLRQLLRAKALEVPTQ